MDSADTEPPLRLLKENKLKKNFTGNKSLMFTSKSLFDLKVKGFQGKILGGHLVFAMDAFYVFPLLIRSILGGVHIIVLRIKKIDNEATSSWA